MYLYLGPQCLGTFQVLLEVWVLIAALGEVDVAGDVEARVGGDVEEEQGVEGAGEGGLIPVPDAPGDRVPPLLLLLLPHPLQHAAPALRIGTQPRFHGYWGRGVTARMARG